MIETELVDFNLAFRAFLLSIPSETKVFCRELWLIFIVFVGICNVDLTAVSGTIMSPNHPNNYPSSIQCLWLIDLGITHDITLTFYKFELEKKEDCSYDWVSVREGKTETSPEMISVCGDVLPPTIISKGPMRIYFQTDSDKEFAGFHMKYEAEGKKYD